MLSRLPRLPSGVIVDNDEMATGMEKKEIEGTADIFWSREPIMGPKGTKENPAIVPSFNTSRVVGLETEQVRRIPRMRERARKSVPVGPCSRGLPFSPCSSSEAH